HEASRLVRGELLRGRHGLVDRGSHRHVLSMEELEGGDAQNRAVDRGEAINGPVLGRLSDRRVELGERSARSGDDLDRVRVGFGSLLLRRVAEELHGVAAGEIRRIEREQCGATRRAPARAAVRAHFTRSMYSPLRVSTFRRSPSPTKSGTWTTRPVSSVAGLSAPLTRSPFTPGSVAATVRATEAGSSTETGVPSWVATDAVAPSVR